MARLTPKKPGLKRHKPEHVPDPTGSDSSFRPGGIAPGVPGSKERPNVPATVGGRTPPRLGSGDAAVFGLALAPSEWSAFIYTWNPTCWMPLMAPTEDEPERRVLLPRLAKRLLKPGVGSMRAEGVQSSVAIREARNHDENRGWYWLDTEDGPGGESYLRTYPSRQIDEWQRDDPEFMIWADCWTEFLALGDPSRAPAIRYHSGAYSRWLADLVARERISLPTFPMIREWDIRAREALQRLIDKADTKGGKPARKFLAAFEADVAAVQAVQAAYDAGSLVEYYREVSESTELFTR